MGEGRDGPSNSPLPKVLVRSEEESLKFTTNQLKEEYLSVSPSVTRTSQRATFILPRALHLTPIGTIVPEDCDLLTASLFPESVCPDHQEKVPTPVSSPSPVVTRDAVVVTRDAVVVTKGTVVVTRHAVVVTRDAVVVTRDAVVATRVTVVVTRVTVVVTSDAVVVTRDYVTKDAV